MRGVRVFGALVGLTALIAAGSAAAAGTGVADPPPQADRGLVDARVCGPPTPGSAACHAHVLARPDGHGGVAPNVTSSPAGLSPDQVRHAYGFPSDFTGTTPTIAIVDAYDAPHIEADLAAFSAQFNLPDCTTANGCFKKVNQNGGTPYPRKDSGWALEIALDVEWAHAIAPTANILLVEASTNSFANLLVAEDYAAAHAGYVSNSWGAPEFSGETTYDSHFMRDGVSYFVSAGDNGTPAEYPSSSPKVISVGGTTLDMSGTTFVSESGWSSGGGGCSIYELATDDQEPTSQSLCGAQRATPDVSLVADPATGVSVYSSDYSVKPGWYRVGGTSASAPMWAARSALTNLTVDSAYVYARGASTFRDITDGNNGEPCSTGFDLCTGRGSWIDGVTSGGGGGGGGGGGTTLDATFSTTCAGATCDFSAANTTYASYAWGGATSNGTGTASRTFSSPGSYVVQLTVTDTQGNTGSSSDTVSCTWTGKGRNKSLTCN